MEGTLRRPSSPIVRSSSARSTCANVSPLMPVAANSSCLQQGGAACSGAGVVTRQKASKGGRNE